jgi:hypothetical protein
VDKNPPIIIVIPDDSDVSESVDTRIGMLIERVRSKPKDKDRS